MPLQIEKLFPLVHSSPLESHESCMERDLPSEEDDRADKRPCSLMKVSQTGHCGLASCPGAESRNSSSTRLVSLTRNFPWRF